MAAAIQGEQIVARVAGLHEHSEDVVAIKFIALSDAGHRRSVQGPTATTSVEGILPFPGDLPTQERISELELDDFRVALVPFEVSLTRDRAIHAARSDTSRLLILPLTWKELMLKLGTSTRYASHSNKTDVVRFGEVTVDLASMEVRRSNSPVNLTAMEFKVLKYFVANPNRVFSRNDLLDQVWGYENYPCTRTVDNHILRLRQKLEPDFANPVYFQTVYGMGYKFTP
jgi:DNA-binding winged helix-turn-helix (wHTH) protein